jgi:hypothetical protein
MTTARKLSVAAVGNWLATGFFGNWISGISTKKSMSWAATSVAGWQLLGISLATAIHAFIQ